MSLPMNCKRVIPDELRLRVRRKSPDEPHFEIYQDSFLQLLGNEPLIELKLEESRPLFHEAGVYFPENDSLFVTSSRLAEDGRPTIIISRLQRYPDGSWTREPVPTGGAFMPNGGINHPAMNGVVFCAQGTSDDAGGLVFMSKSMPYETKPVIQSYYGRWFNSVNDIVFASDGSIWFTDPTYGYEQGFRPVPVLPSQVYCFDPADGSVRVVATGFGHPNGLCFSPDEKTMYVTDTDWIQGEGVTDDRRLSHIFAFDVEICYGSKFLTNRRVFAMADTGVPDGIKCSVDGNVYSGCGDGVSVWSAGGILLGKLIVPGGIANFCFGRPGELFLLNETKFWVAKMAPHVRGALLDGMGVDFDKK